jgi:hypothetical protein
MNHNKKRPQYRGLLFYRYRYVLGDGVKGVSALFFDGL